MKHHTKAEDRICDYRLAVPSTLPTTVRSRSAVSKLHAMPPKNQTFCIAQYAQRNLPHLCAARQRRGAASFSPDTRWGEQDAPMLCIAAFPALNF